jgi:hypothetical protein
MPAMVNGPSVPIPKFASFRSPRERTSESKGHGQCYDSSAVSVQKFPCKTRGKTEGNF